MAKSVSGAILQSVPLDPRHPETGLPLSGPNAPENATLTNDSERLMFGLSGEKNDWIGEFWVQKYWHESTRTEPGNWIASALQRALTDGTFNPFGIAIAQPDLISPKDGSTVAGHNFEFIAAQLSHTELMRRESEQSTIDFLISNGALFEVPSGDVGIAFGYQHREEEFLFEPDPLDAFGLGSNPRTAPVPSVTGSTKVDAFFAEMALPVLDSLFGAEASISIGANNLFDKDPPPIGTRRPGYDSQVHDIRGRIIYLDVTVFF